MAKLSFNKLGLKLENKIQKVPIDGYEVEVEVKQYLPVNEKLELASRVINACAEDEKFYNPGKIEIFFVLEMIFTYTNFNFTDKQKSDPCKLYDLVEQNGIARLVMDNIPEREIDFIYSTIQNSIEAIYKYNNSVFGILDNITSDYEGLNFDIGDLYNKLSNKENVEFLKEVIDKLG